MTLLRQWAQAEKALDDAKASGNHDAVRTLVPTVNALRRQVRDLRIVGDSPNDKLLAAIFGGERIDLNQWRQYL